MPINPQAPSAVVMIRPHHFTPNPQTEGDNGFQSKPPNQDKLDIAARAYREVTDAEFQLQQAGIKVHLFEDTSTDTPDSVFPNNWFSTHIGGYIALYPMFAENRRLERRYDVIEMLKRDYRVQEVVDYSGLEQDDLFLEGTGAMVLDHHERIAYTCESNRTSPIVLERFCTHFNYEPMAFKALDEQQHPIYHTNVLMCIATEFVLLGIDHITNRKRRDEIKLRFESGGKTVIPLTNRQINHFCGNAIELTGSEGRVLALSQTAFESLTDEQKQLIEQSAKILPLAVPTIELAGGSVRCMLAGIHLSKRR